MTAHQKEIAELSNEQLIERFDGNITTQIRELDKYGRITKSTQKRHEDIKSEMMKRMGC